MSKGKYKLEYSSNNSGGRWWLKDTDWEAMEKAGWVVQWGQLYFCNSEGYLDRDAPIPVVDPPCPLPTPVEGRSWKDNPCHGHRRFQNYEEASRGNYRWLGTLARDAYIYTDDPKKTIREWEIMTHQDASDEGCNCCGEPHNFHWTDEDGGYHTIEMHRSSSWS